MSSRSSTRWKTLGWVIAALLLTAGLGLWQSREPANLRIWFADVGQGDGTIIRTPSHETIVIDGGVRQDFTREVDSHVPLTDRTIDLAVATHADSDHITGLIALIDSGRVRSVLINRDVTVTTQRYMSLWQAIERRHVQVIEAQAGQDLTYGDVQLHVLWPTPDGFTKATSTNERSIVLRLSYGQEDVLFTGDAPDTVEAMLLVSHADVASEVLKVGHHGSAKSSTLQFLQAVHPQLATISVGAGNTYGHPTKRVLDDLQRVNAKVIRTDEHGDILVTCSITACTPSTDK